MLRTQHLLNIGVRALVFRISELTSQTKSRFSSGLRPVLSGTRPGKSAFCLGSLNILKTSALTHIFSNVRFDFLGNLW